jgi:2-dehydropantoate 2-reductase
MQGITIAGAGALGRGLAGLLGQRNTVTLLARAQTADTLLEEGRLHIGGVQPIQLPLRAGIGAPGSVGVIADPEQMPPDDAVIFATKAPQLESFAIEVHARWRRSRGWVAGLQNGIGTEDLLVGKFGPSAVVGAATMTAAGRGPDGFSVTAISTTYFGELGGGVSERVSAMADAFESANLPVEVPEDIRSLLWTKCANTVGVFATSSLTRLDTGTILGNGHSVAAYLDLVGETAALARALGTQIGDFDGLPLRAYLTSPRADVIDAFVARARAAGAPSTLSYTSMARDIIEGRPTEVEYVFGDLVRRSEQVGLAVPRLALAYDLLSAMSR